MRPMAPERATLPGLVGGSNMKRVGVIGLGNMGSGIARNLIASGFETVGFDLDETRMQDFTELGGVPASSPAEAGRDCQAVFVMVMNGDQARSVILGKGLASTMAAGSVILLTATIQPHEARSIAAGLEGSGVLLVDTPVSGGFPGAQSGTLILMAAGSEIALSTARPAMEAVSKTIQVVGSEPGLGQTVKAVLQSLMGAIFGATFEAAVLAAKSGVRGEVLLDVVKGSSASCEAAESALKNIIDRKFVGTGSHIFTMHKDLGISLDLARSLDVPLFTAAAAMQLFTAGKSRHPDGDNWVVTRILEDIAGAELHR